MMKFRGKQDKLKIRIIRLLQKQNGIDVLQKEIDDGMIWEDPIRRAEAHEAITSGTCMLSKFAYVCDLDGMVVPARQMLQSGAVGSFGRCESYWLGIVNKGK